MQSYSFSLSKTVSYNVYGNERPISPRQLVVYSEVTGDWKLIDESSSNNKTILSSIRYLAVSYRKSDYTNKQKELEESVKNICEGLNLDAYWLECVCFGKTSEERATDLYRMADIFRSADAIVILLAEVDGWKRWGECLCMYPEALQNINLYCKEGVMRVRAISPQQVIHLVTDYRTSRDELEKDHKLLNFIVSRGCDTEQFEDRIAHVCSSVWSRPNEGHEFMAGQRVYSLMRVFQTQITPNPSETEAKAFDRLMEANKLTFNVYPWEAIEKKTELVIKNKAKIANGICKLKFAKAARYNDPRSAVKSSCEKGTRIDTLETIYKWLIQDSAPNKDNTRVFWLCGIAGSGKSTIAHTIAKVCDHESILGATFFCSRFAEECSNKSYIFPTIAHQLSKVDDNFEQGLINVLDTYDDFNFADPSEQLEKLIVEPLKDTKKLSRYVIIIDALDECSDDMSISEVLSALNDHMTALFPLKFLITSRPERHILNGVRMLDINTYSNSHDLRSSNATQADIDIRIYLRNGLSEVASAMKELWPSEEVIDELVKRANGLFLFASTIISFLKDQRVHDLDDQLQKLLSSADYNSPYSHLDSLYLQILQDKFRYANESLIKNFRKALSILLAAREPMSVDCLEGIMPGVDIRDTFQNFQQLLSIPELNSGPIHVVHPFIEGFFLDEKRCIDSRFQIKNSLEIITECCIQKLDEFAISDARVQAYLANPSPEERTSVRKALGDTNHKDDFKYSFSHWMWHISNLEVEKLSSLMDGVLGKFLSNDLLVDLFLTDEVDSYILANWACDILLCTLKKSAVNTSAQLIFGLYETALLFIGKYYFSSSLADLFSFVFEETYAYRLIDAKECIKKTATQRFTGLTANSIRVEILLMGLKYGYIECDKSLCREALDLHQMLLTTEDASEDLRFDKALDALAMELKYHLKLKEIYGRLTKRELNFKFLSLSQIIIRYKRLIGFIRQCGTHSISKLYRRTLDIVLQRRILDKHSEDAIKVTLLTLFFSSEVSSVRKLESQMSLMSHSTSYALENLSSICMFVISPSEAFSIDGYLDFDMLSYMGSPNPDNVLLPECDSYSKVHNYEERCRNRDKFSKVDQIVFLDYVSIIEGSQVDAITGGKDHLLNDTREINLLLAKRCLRQILDFLKERVGESVFVDLWPNTSIKSNASMPVYARDHWDQHTRVCIHTFDKEIIVLLEEVLSYHDGLFCYTTRNNRQKLCALYTDLFDAFMDTHPNPMNNLINLLYDATIFSNLPLWAVGNRDEIKAEKIRRMRRVVVERYMHLDGLYELDGCFPFLRIALQAYNKCQIIGSEKLAPECQELRQLADEIHKFILQQHAPQNADGRDKVEEAVSDLVKSLETNSEKYFYPYTQSDIFDEENIIELRGVINRCQESLRQFRKTVSSIMERQIYSLHGTKRRVSNQELNVTPSDSTSENPPKRRTLSRTTSIADDSG